MERKIAMIIAPQGFQDTEFGTPYNFFVEQGAIVDVFSTRKGIATGSFGLEFEVTKTLDELDVADYDAIVFIGGPGTAIVRKEEKALEIAKEAVRQDKVLGAICWSPTILAKAGVLKDVNATVWLGHDREYGMTTNKYLESSGAKYVNKNVVVDNRIVTADGPPAAEKYAKEIWNLLK